LANLAVYHSKKTDQSSFFAIDYHSLEVISVKQGISYFNESNKRIIFAFNDPNSQSSFPGWPLRNFLALLSFNWYNFLIVFNSKRIKIINKYFKVKNQ